MARPVTTYVDLTGRVYGRYRVLGRAGNGPQWQTLWRCLCDPVLGGCGTVRTVTGTSLSHNGVTKCRGCVGRDLAARQAGAGHSGAGGRLYQRIWPRTCPTCGADFRGTARQKYCCEAHRPSRRKDA